MLEFHLYPAWAEGILVAMIGLLFGSFVTLASYRIPRGESGILFGRSQCPKCKHTLHVCDLFPLFSWMFLKGRCRYCHASVGGGYPLIEVSQAIMFLLVYAKYGLTIQSLVLALLSVCLLIMIVIDFEFLIIPNVLNIIMATLGGLYAFLFGDILSAIFYGAAGMATGVFLRWIFTRWKGVEALGLGDVKFLGVVGVFLGADLFITFFFIAGMVGIITAAIWQRAGKGRHFPFGPALAVALFVCVLVPEVQGTLREQVVQILLGYI